jgi:subtilisin family serine protease
LWSHAETGLAVVTSSNPDFLDEVMSSRRFRDGYRDEMIDWEIPVIADDTEFDIVPTVPRAAEVTPDDETFFSLQWNMQSIDAPQAWATGATGAGARVAILDGGIYDVHPDIAPKLDVGCSKSFVDGQAFNDDLGTFWHGTHVAGIVGAADNGFGVIGVAPDATLMGVKVLHGGSGSFGSTIGGILFASDPQAFGTGCTQRADIINMSLASAFFQHDFPGFRSDLNRAVNFAASRGTLVISAAANHGLDFGQLRDAIVIPAQSGSGLAVSATGPVNFAGGGTDFRRFASYSNWGEDLVTVAAPGGDFTLFPNGLWFHDMVLSTCRGKSTPPTFSFCFSAGTSMAAPAAAGVAALIKSENPDISLGALKAALKNSADDEGKIGHDEFYGHGFVNAHRAVTNH